MTPEERHQEDERLLVLNMLKEGKLTPDEADELLVAIDAAEVAESGTAPTGPDSGSAATAPSAPFTPPTVPVPPSAPSSPSPSSPPTPPIPPVSPDQTADPTGSGRRFGFSFGDLDGVQDDVGGAIRDALAEARDAINEGLTAAGDLARSTVRENRAAVRDAIRQSVRQAAFEARNAARAARIEARRAMQQARVEARRAAGSIRMHGGFFGSDISSQMVLSGDLKPGGNLVVQVPQGDIQVTGTSGNKVEVEAQIKVRARDGAEAHRLLSGTHVALSDSGKDLLLTAAAPAALGALGSKLWVDLEIQLPRGAGLVISTSHGDIGVDGTEGTHRIQVVRGDIEVSGASGHFDISAKEGDIELDRCTAQTLKLEGDHGDIESRFTPAGDGPFTIQTVYGDCEVTLPPGSAYDLEVSAVGGDVEVKLGGQCRPSSVTSHSWQGKVNGGGPAIKVSSIRGDIEVRS